MEVQVELPSSPTTHDFNFHGSAPSNWFYSVSAPTSPSRSSELYRDFDSFSVINETDDFAFEVSKEAAKCTVSAADLFDGGIIRPLNHRSSFTYGDTYEEVETTTTSITSPLLSSNRSPKSPNSKENMNCSKGRKTFWNVFTPKRNKQTKAHATLLDDENDGGRGRCLTKSTSNRRGTRSLSPIRLTECGPWQYDKKKESISSSTSCKSSRMSKLKNFLLFRSASEGRASYKLEPLKKSGGAHERHYAMKKAASEDLKKKTFLPYKSGILGR